MMIQVAPIPATRTSAPRSKPYVLLVDDHEPSLRRLDQVVRMLGYRSVTVNSGSEALHCCDGILPHVVVTDFSMPNLDGQGLARWLHDRHPSLPIILLTGQVFDERSLTRMRRLFAAILTKPLDIERLVGLLDRLMPPGGNCGPPGPRRS